MLQPSWRGAKAPAFEDNQGDRSDYEVKAVAYDKVGHTSAQVEKNGVKLDKHLELKFWFKDEDQRNRGDKLGDVVMKQQTFSYTAGGGSGTETTRYYYNQARMLEYIDLEEDGQDLKFAYDGLGRRIMVQRGNIGYVYDGKVVSFTPVETKKYVYLGGSVIRELDNDTPPNVLKEYARGLDLGGGIGGIIYQKRSSDYYYYHYNHKGDVVGLTEADEDLAAYYEYDAWGNTMTEAEVTGVDNPYRYSTKEWDEKSGLYYFGARYYSPEIGRWTQRDSAGTVDGPNLYLYAACNPASSMDPWGNMVIPGTDPSYAHDSCQHIPRPPNAPLYRQVDIGVYLYRSGPGWLIELLCASRNMCHYWMEGADSGFQSGSGRGMRCDVIFGARENRGNYDVPYNPAAKWPVYWEKSDRRRLKGSGKKCDQVTPKEIYKCLLKSGDDNWHKHQDKATGSCLSYVKNVMEDCCLVQGAAIYNDVTAAPIGLPWWVPWVVDLVAPPVY